MNTSTVQSVLRPIISRYLKLQWALGKGFDRERRILESLDQWLSERGAADVDAQHFTAWSMSKQHLASGVRRNHMRIMRNFCLYRRRSDPTCFVPGLQSFPANHQLLQPYIFTEAQIAELIQAADQLEALPFSPLRPQVYRLAIVLLYTTGLRRGELLRLTINDYDSQQQSLFVRQSKFHKSRQLPLSVDTAQEIATYLEVRRQHHLFAPNCRCWPLTWGMSLSSPPSAICTLSMSWHPTQVIALTLIAVPLSYRCRRHQGVDYDDPIPQHLGTSSTAVFH